MKPRKKTGSHLNLFTSRLENILDPEHPLVVLAGLIDWKTFEEACEACYCSDFGPPAKATRLMVGLHYLKHAYNESDESVVEKWMENPYWMYFCGFDYMQHEPPIHPTSMTKWRNRMGKENIELLLRATLDTAVKGRFVDPKEFRHVNVDTTVQEKNVAFPTDSSLLHKAIVKLADAAAERGIALRQSYRRVAKKAALMAGRYAHAMQYTRMRKEPRFLRGRLGGTHASGHGLKIPLL